MARFTQMSCIGLILFAAAAFAAAQSEQSNTAQPPAQSAPAPQETTAAPTAAPAPAPAAAAAPVPAAAPAPASAAAPAAPTAPAPAAAAPATPAAPPAATESGSAAAFAHLYVYRQRRYVGSALAPSIFVDDKPVVRIGNGRRASIKLSPGPHTIRSDDKSSAISIEVKAGQNYYVRVDEQAGFWKGHGKLTMLQPEQGGPEYKMQKPVEEDRKAAKEMIEADAEAPISKDDVKKEK